MTAMRLDGGASRLRSRHQAQQILRGLEKVVPIERHSRATVAGDLPDALRNQTLSEPALVLQAERGGLFQLGTLGRGNHFLEIQADDQEQMWLMVHSGSRGLGQAIATRHFARAVDTGRELRVLDANEAAGQAYLNDLAWAVRYASRAAWPCSARRPTCSGHCWRPGPTRSPWSTPRTTWSAGRTLRESGSGASQGRHGRQGW